MLPQNSSCQHAVINTPVDSDNARFARFLSDGSLPHVWAGSASTLDGFGTCSMFICITACWLANPLTGPFYTKGFGPFIASTPASAATLGATLFWFNSASVENAGFGIELTH